MRPTPKLIQHNPELFAAFMLGTFVEQRQDWMFKARKYTDPADQNLKAICVKNARRAHHSYLAELSFLKTLRAQFHLVG
jgi:hypothetical protein